MKNPKRFQRKIEDFICEYCSSYVKGDGYTDHCPECLYGKHADIFPGDRMEACGGQLKPVGYYGTGRDAVVIEYKCCACGAEKRNKMGKKDNFEVLLKIKA